MRSLRRHWRGMLRFIMAEVRNNAKVLFVLILG
jgi:hypothetical protein